MGPPFFLAVFLKNGTIPRQFQHLPWYKVEQRVFGVRLENRDQLTEVYRCPDIYIDVGFGECRPLGEDEQLLLYGG